MGPQIAKNCRRLKSAVGFFTFHNRWCQSADPTLELREYSTCEESLSCTHHARHKVFFSFLETHLSLKVFFPPEGMITEAGLRQTMI